MIAHEPLSIAAQRSLRHYTHEKKPVACAARLAALQVIEEQQLVARAAAIGAQTVADLRRRLASSPLCAKYADWAC